MSKFDSISQLLPEGLTEETVEQIASLVNEVISEEVDGRVKDLENKVHGFLRMKIDEVKEHAVAELEQENDIYKNARLFESLKALMALEINSGDEDNAIAQTRREFDELQEENAVLIRELNNSLSDSTKLENALKVVSNKVKQLEEDKEDLTEEIVNLEEASEVPFESNERALIISEKVDSEVISEEVPDYGNQFLTEEMMAFMPFKR